MSKKFLGLSKLNKYPILLSYIFQFSTIKEIDKVITKVCKVWEENSKHPIVWNKRKIEISHPQQILDYNKECPTISSFSCGPPNDWVEGYEFGCLYNFSKQRTSWKHLHSLELIVIVIQSIQGIEGLKDTLETLEISSVTIEDQNLLPITELTNLKTLKWDGHYANETFKDFIEWNRDLVLIRNSWERLNKMISYKRYPVHKFPGYKLINLTELHLQNRACTLLNGFATLEKEPTLKKLQKLKLERCRYIKQDDLVILRNHNFNYVKELHIQQAEDPSNSIDPSFLEAFTQLEKVHLQWCNFTKWRLPIQLVFQNNYKSLKDFHFKNISTTEKEKEQEEFRSYLKVEKVCAHLKSFSLSPSPEQIKKEIAKIFFNIKNF